MKIIYQKYIGYYFFVMLFFIPSQNSKAQQFRYTTQVFNKVDTLKEVEYARALWLNNPISILAENNILVHNGENITEERPLFMDIFMPHSDTISKRPVIIFMHSGGFLQGSRLNEDMVAMCDSFARKGYVTATIDYRLGMGATLNFLTLTVNEINGYRAAYRGMQDTKAAIRFLKHNAEMYGIDTTKIYLTGSSAGSILALNNIYINNNEIKDFAFASPSLGNIDAIGVQGYGSKADAATSLWGAIETPELIGNDSTPVFLVHGTDDDIVPYKKGEPLAALIPQELKTFIHLNLPDTYGGFCIDTALINRSINHETYFVEGQKHEFYGVATGDFNEGGPNAYWDTIQSKMTDFFAAQFKPEAKIDYYMNNLELTFHNESVEPEYTFWDFGDGTTSTEKIASHTYAEKGTYEVTLTTCNQNMACDVVSTNITVGIIDNINLTGDNEISFYPNPVKNLLIISGIDVLFDVSIYDLTGRVKISKKDVTGNSIDLSELENGIYVMTIQTGKQLISHKIIKTK